MRLANNKIGLKLVIEIELIQKLYTLGIKYYPKEYGGLLIGHYSGDKKTAIIKESIAPNKFKSSKYGFERDSKGLKKTLEKLYQQNPSLFYLGEWHTHPDNPPLPSTTDLQSLRYLAEHEKVLIRNPVLLIMSINKKKYELGFYVYYKNKVSKYEKV